MAGDETFGDAGSDMGADSGSPTVPGTPRMPTPPGPPSMPRPESDSSRRKVFGVIACVVIAILIVSNIALWIALASTKSDADEAKERSELAASSLADVSDRVDTMETSLGDVGGGAEDISGRVDEIETNLEDLQSCVDDYLHAVNASGGGSYTFRYC